MNHSKTCKCFLQSKTGPAVGRRPRAPVLHGSNAKNVVSRVTAPDSSDRSAGIVVAVVLCVVFVGC